MIKAHKGPPPIGWENVPGMVGFIREKKAKGSGAGDGGIGMAELAKVLSGLEMAKGRDGVDGRDGRDGADARDPTPQEIQAAAAHWLNSNIKQPVDGRDGKDAEVDYEKVSDIIAQTHGKYISAEAEKVRQILGV